MQATLQEHQNDSKMESTRVLTGNSIRYRSIVEGLPPVVGNDADGAVIRPPSRRLSELTRHESSARGKCDLRLAAIGPRNAIQPGAQIVESRLDREKKVVQRGFDRVEWLHHPGLLGDLLGLARGCEV